MATETEKETVEGELVAIRRLLMFALVRSGCSQDELANALGVSQSSISRMLPTKAVKGRSKRRR